MMGEISEASRAHRIASVGFDFKRQPQHSQRNCNLCGSREFDVVTLGDRYGFPVPTVRCNRCGLEFLNPRLTKKGYQEFYSRWYRPLVSAFSGEVSDARAIQQSQHLYGRELAKRLRDHVASRDYKTMLDVGGSTGAVASVLCEEYGWEATVLDPSEEEIEEAGRKGFRTIHSSVEDWFTDGEYDVVCCLQTIEHLWDPRQAMEKMALSLAPGGMMVIDIVTAVPKLDHPFTLSKVTLGRYLALFDLEAVASFHFSHNTFFVCRQRAA